MPIVKIENPFTKTVEQVEIAGDEPTQKELDTLFQLFQSEAQPTSTEVDLSTASVEEIRDYARQKRLQGLNPVTGELLTEEEYVSKYKEPGVDYSTGLDSVAGFSRFQFGRMDTQEEKTDYLRDVVGEEGFRVDPLGRHILTQAGRTKLGLGEGRELAIDEEGLSFGDVKEFFGAAAVPIATGIGAGLMASGVGFFPGIFIVGAATGAGKLLDEGIETIEGRQRQSFVDVARDSAMEGVFGAAGEGLGRGISKLFGRIIKGPGGEANEALRAQARELINKGYRPTIAGATDESFRPILNRLQAVYEGVFPNKAAAQANLENVVEELRRAGISDATAINNLDEVVKKDIDNFYATSDEALATAQRNLNEAVENEIGQVMRGLKDGKTIPKDLKDMIYQRKAIFDEDLDRLYTKTNNILRGQKIIPTKGIQAELARLEADSIADIGSTKFAAQVRALGDFATPQELARIRTGLTDATYNPALLNDVNVGSLGALKSSINQAFADAEITLSSIANAPTKGDELLIVPDGFKINVSMQDAAEALNLLTRTNNLYRKGIKRFDNVVVQDIVKQAQNGQMNMKFIFDKIVQEDNPEAFDQLMKAIRGVDTGKALGAEFGIADLDAGARMLKSSMIGNRTVEQALMDVRNLPAGNRTRRMVEMRAAELEKEAFERSKIRGKGAEMADEVRQGLARMYLQQQINKSIVVDAATGERVIDGVALAANIRQKGSTVDKLFGKDLKQVDDILTVMDRQKANLAPSVIDDLQSKPLGQALRDFQAAQKTRRAVDKNVIKNVLESTSDPDVIAQTVFRSPASIKQAEQFLNPVTMDRTRDAAMGRILKQIGATVDEAGQVRMSDDFVESFKSGKLGNKLQSVLRSYGDETINAMFGRDAAEGLNALAETMIKASNAAIAGKGGLAAPQIALGLGVASMIMNPLATLPAALAYGFMSKALRDPRVLKMMMASRRPNTVKEFLSGKLKADDPLAQGFQALWQLSGAATVQGIRGIGEQTAEEAAPALEMTRQQVAPQVQALAQNIPQIASPTAGTAGQVSPILLPDPATQALAQSLGRSQ